MPDINKDKDIVLKPLAGMRGKPHTSLRGCSVEAHVFVDFDTETTYHNDYQHPIIELHKVYSAYGDDRMSDILCTVRYQRSNVTRGDWKGQDRATGFLKGNRGCWSYSYGETYSGNRLNYLTAGLKLIERANDAITEYEPLSRGERVHRALCKANDPLLTLIVGLRKIGVTVVLKYARNWTTLPAQYSLVA